MMQEGYSSLGIAGRPNLIAAVLLGTIILGVLCYIGAFCSQRHKLGGFREFLVLSLKFEESQLRGVQNTYGALFALLVEDALNVISGVIFAVLLLIHNCGEDCIIISYIWLLLRWISLANHLIAALISVLFLSHPSWGSRLLRITGVLDVVPYVFAILYNRVSELFVFALDAYKLLLFLAIVVTCLLSVSSNAADQMKSIGFVAVLTYLLICLPDLVLHCLQFTSPGYEYISVNVLYLTNFHLFMDGLLCHFILKMRVEDQCDNAIRTT